MLRAIMLSLALCLPWQVAAQDGRATLVADQIGFVSGTQTLEAAGNVEILQDGIKLSASSVRYDGANDLLSIEGPLYITEPDGTVISAEFAELSGDLQEGVLEQARLVFNEQLQLASVELRRSEGRYTQLYKTTVSSCTICADNPTPLWEIRARRVIHDAEERQLYFDQASLRVAGVPVFYTPYLRLPDPSVDRATGFLIPELRSNEELGVGLRVPYFFVLNDHADLTLTPWLTDQGARTLEGRYRQKFRYGEIELNGAVTDDNLTDQNLRSYLFADGTFALPRGFSGKFDVELTSDAGYLLLYDYSDKDRLDSAIGVERANRDEYIGAELVHFKSLREGDDNRSIPTIVGDASIIRRYDLPRVGGLLTTSLEASGLFRRSSFDPTETGLARDVGRLSAVGNWRRDWVLRNGMVLAAETELRADVYRVRQETREEFGDTTEVTPYAALEWRWPMLRRQGRVSHLLEPVAQFVWARENDRDVVNEDSLIVEFDEANLFRFSRFPGVDVQEDGRRLNLGLTYTRDDPNGWSLGVTVGRVIRETNLEQFSQSSGLQGSSSDWLVAAQLKIGEDVNLLNRSIFDDGLSLARNEMRLDWRTEDYGLSSTFVWLESDVTEGRLENTSELSIDGDYRLTPYWTISSDLRYDFVNDDTIGAGIGLTWENECAKVDFSVSRRFTSSTSVEPATDLNLSVQLAGFGGGARQNSRFTRRCNG